ncbi:MAG: hypothetical protein ISR65_03365 [Bacteriovoracaceae bacterium]|nr:hypothetical protein [Bacteriovoracaceae bacterium]
MNFFILCENLQLYSAKRLVEEASKLGIDTTFINPYRYHLNLLPTSGMRKDTHCGDLVFHRTTGIRFDDFDLAISFDMEQRGAKVVNSPSKLLKFRDKQLQTVFLHNQQIKHIPSFSFRGPPQNEHYEQINEYMKSLSLPNGRQSFVVKTIRGNQGIGVNLINGLESLKSLLETFHALRDQQFIIQPYLRSPEEYRLLIVKGEIMGIVKKDTSDDTFRNNAKRNTNAKYLSSSSLSKEIVDLAFKVYNSIDCFYAGIDILVSDGKLFVLELNMVPGFMQLEELSGINIAKELLVRGL